MTKKNEFKHFGKNLSKLLQIAIINKDIIFEY